MAPNKKKRVYFENIKVDHTTHWDLDYLSRAELDALYQKNRRKNVFSKLSLKRIPSRTLLKFILAGATLMFLASFILLLQRLA